MHTAAAPKSKKSPDVSVLRCLRPGCGGLLAYEVDSSNVLYVDLTWTAKRDGSTRYFPCPKCGGKNIVEEFRTEKGDVKHRVAAWRA